MNTLTGGCACGALRYRFEAEPRFAFICQCRACQQTTGSDHAAQVCLDADGLSLSGESKSWSRQAASGNSVEQVFCPVCGTTVLARPSRAPAIAMLMAGTLDNPAAVTPDRMFYAEERIPWDRARVEAAE